MTVFFLSFSSKQCREEKSQTRRTCETKPQRKIGAVTSNRQLNLRVSKRSSRYLVFSDCSRIAACIDTIHGVAAFGYRIYRAGRQSADCDAFAMLEQDGITALNDTAFTSGIAVASFCIECDRESEIFRLIALITSNGFLNGKVANFRSKSVVWCSSYW